MILTAVIVLAILAGSFAYLLTKKMTKTADQFISLLANDYPDQAYQLFTTKFKEQTSHEDFTKSLTTSLSAKPRSVKWTGREVNNGNGKVEGVVTLANDHTFSIILELEKENGEWRIHYMELHPVADEKIDSK